MMTTRAKAAKGSALLAGGAAVAQCAALIRNVILAKLLSKADFGIAATFAMIVSLLEFSAKLGISRFVIQDRDGGTPAFIASAHLFQSVAAISGGLLILVAAPFLAGLFGIPEHVWALRLLSVVAFCRGFEHLDIFRFERELRFGPSTGVEVASQIAITVLAWPVAQWLGDVRAVLLLLITRSLLTCFYTHWVAEVPYRWQYHPEFFRRTLRFGWPLLVNGFLMFGILQGDQFLVALFYSMADLGPYAAAAGLAIAPTFLFGRIFNSVMLPLFARVQNEEDRFRRRYIQALAILSGFAVFCTVGLVVGSESIMLIVYGAKYAGSGPILAWLAAATAFRTLRIAPALAALAKGDTQNQMRSNVWRLAALIPALPLAVFGFPVWAIACTGLVGEFLACTASFLRLRSQYSIAVSVHALPTLAVACSTLGAFLISQTPLCHGNPRLGLAIAAALAVAAGFVVTALLPELRTEARSMLARFRPGLKRAS